MSSPSWTTERSSTGSVSSTRTSSSARRAQAGAHTEERGGAGAREGAALPEDSPVGGAATPLTSGFAVAVIRRHDTKQVFELQLHAPPDPDAERTRRRPPG